MIKLIYKNNLYNILYLFLMIYVKNLNYSDYEVILINYNNYVLINEQLIFNYYDIYFQDFNKLFYKIQKGINLSKLTYLELQNILLNKIYDKLNLKIIDEKNINDNNIKEDDIEDLYDYFLLKYPISSFVYNRFKKLSFYDNGVLNYKFIILNRNNEAYWFDRKQKYFNLVLKELTLLIENDDKTNNIILKNDNMMLIVNNIQNVIIIFIIIILIISFIIKTIKSSK